MKTKTEITIMADFGMGPYAWLTTQSLHSCRERVCIADSLVGFQGKYPVCQATEEEFAKWAMHFENYSHMESFDWPVWTDRGIALAEILAFELGPDYIISYSPPAESPHAGEEMEIKIA